MGGTNSLARSQSDISNSAIRIFLQRVGEYYDEARGFQKFRPTRLQKQELVDWFARECCYCAAEVSAENFTQDHLIPMNKESLGLPKGGWSLLALFGSAVQPSCKILCSYLEQPTPARHRERNKAKAEQQPGGGLRQRSVG